MKSYDKSEKPIVIDKSYFETSLKEDEKEYKSGAEAIETSRQEMIKMLEEFIEDREERANNIQILEEINALKSSDNIINNESSNEMTEEEDGTTEGENKKKIPTLDSIFLNVIKKSRF